MTVYVDPPRSPYRGMVMCHMWADGTEELLAMADAIGLSRKHLQQPPAASWTHFDLGEGKRALAIAAGAVEATSRAAVIAQRQQLVSQAAALAITEGVL